MMLIVPVLVSVIIVSLISFIGVIILFLRWKAKPSEEFLLLWVSLSAGSLFGGAFLHLLPEALEKQGFSFKISLLVLLGVVTFFVLEKFIHWHHCHEHHLGGHQHKHHQDHLPAKDGKVQIAVLNLIGDGIHNFLDGLVIAGSYLVSIPTGIATTIAVVVHEVPQEIGDFGVLLYSGFSKMKALWFNFLSATTAIAGAVVGIVWGSRSDLFINLILPFAAGGFVYIAGSNLIPELHKGCDFKDSFWHVVLFVLGIGLMLGLAVLE